MHLRPEEPSQSEKLELTVLSHVSPNQEAEASAVEVLKNLCWKPGDYDQGEDWRSSEGQSELPSSFSFYSIQVPSPWVGATHT